MEIKKEEKKDEESAPFNLADLKREVPYKWRVQSFSKNFPSAQCVAYLDSRQVQDILDDVVGPENWQCKYSEHKNNLFCSIGIKVNGEWVWKDDCGAESNQDKEKGEASDAFKRAAVKWGIGRFLYSVPIEFVKSNVKKENNNWPHVVDKNGDRVYDLSKFINDKKGNNIEQPDSKLPITLTKENQGEFLRNWSGTIDADNIAQAGRSRYQLSEAQAEYFAKHKDYKGEK